MAQPRVTQAIRIDRSKQGALLGRELDRSVIRARVVRGDVGFVRAVGERVATVEAFAAQPLRRLVCARARRHAHREREPRQPGCCGRRFLRAVRGRVRHAGELARPDAPA
eukprot:3474536-Prymnesium_polylepis.1